jgi:hypothetical protein
LARGSQSKPTLFIEDRKLLTAAVLPLDHVAGLPSTTDLRTPKPKMMNQQLDHSTASGISELLIRIGNPDFLTAEELLNASRQ